MYEIPKPKKIAIMDTHVPNAFMFAPALSGNDMARLFSSHPPTEKRIKRLQNMQRELERCRPFRP